MSSKYFPPYESSSNKIKVQLVQLYKVQQVQLLIMQQKMMLKI